MTSLGSVVPRQLFVIVALAVVSLALLVALPLRMATDSLEYQAREHVRDLAETNALAVDGQLDSVRQLVSGSATDAVVSDSAAETADNLDLERLRASSPDMKTAAYVDTSGSVVRVAGADQNTPINVSDRQYFQEALQRSGPYTSGVFVSRQQVPTRVVVVSHAVRDEQGNPVGVLVGSVDVRVGFERWVQSAAMRQDAEVVVYDGAGEVVAGLSGGEQPSVADLDDRYVASVAPVGDSEWEVAAYVSRGTAFAAVDDLRDRTLLVATVLGLVMLAGVVALAREMRARGRAERSLHETEAQVTEVLAAAEQMIFELEPDGRVLACNRSVTSMTGFELSELVGEHLYDVVVPEEHRARARAVFDSLLSSDDPDSWRHRSEGRMLTKFGESELSVEINLWTVRVAERLSVYLIVNDVTKRKRLERDREAVLVQQRRLVEELRQTDKTKSDFVSTVSHELRTPLTSIVGYLEMLQEGYGGDLNEQQVSMLAVVDRNSRRLLGLIEDLLTLSRVESGKLRLEHFDLDVGHLVMNSVQAMIPSATDKQLELSIDIDPDAGVVRGDQNQLERVLLNLLSNAIKFTPEGGNISVRASSANGGVVLQVRDSGIGISGEEQTRLFTRFFRSSEAQELAIQGTGLGLAIVKSIVGLHEGTVEIESEHGSGTTVSVWLPTAHAVARA